MLTKIYRIENPLGGGMYQGDRRVGSNIGKYNVHSMKGIDLIGVNHMGIERMSNENKVPDGIDYRPAPHQDGIHITGTYQQQRKWFYGFKDLNQLLEWFEHKVTVKDIIDVGLRIKVLYVTQVKFGRRQVVYHQNSVKREFCIVNGELNRMYMQQEAADKAKEKAAIAANKAKFDKRLYARSRLVMDEIKGLLDLPPKPIVLEDSDLVKWGTPGMANLLKMAPSPINTMSIEPDDFLVNLAESSVNYTINFTRGKERPINPDAATFTYLNVGVKGVSDAGTENRNSLW